MKRTNLRYGLLTAVLTVSMIGGGTYWVLAQPPSQIAELTLIEGNVAQPTINDHDDGDGWKLESGEVVHIAPHAFAELDKSIKPGQQIRAMTTSKMLRDGTKVNEAVTVQVGDRNFAILPPAPPKPPKPNQPAAEREEPMKTKDKIVSFNENKHGDVDGFVLGDDTEVKFPPHMGDSLMEGMKVGTDVDVRGRRHETPNGDIHLHADEITADGYVYTIDHPKPPKHGPGHGPKLDDWMTKKQGDDMLKEMRAIRKLREANSYSPCEFSSSKFNPTCCISFVRCCKTMAMYFPSRRTLSTTLLPQSRLR